MKTLNKMNNNTSISSYVLGWLGMFFGSLTLNDWAVVVGMLATIFGFLVTWYYKHQDFKLKKQQFKVKKNEKNR